MVLKKFGLVLFTFWAFFLELLLHTFNFVTIFYLKEFYYE